MEQLIEDCDPNTLIKNTPLYGHLNKLMQEYYKNSCLINYLIIETNNLDVLKKKLPLLTKKTLSNCGLSELTYLLIYYTDEHILDLWYYLNPEAYQLFLETNPLINISFESNNLKNLYYLVDTHGVSFWHSFIGTDININEYYKIDPPTFIKIIKRDSIRQYLNEFTAENLLKLTKRIKNVEVINIICSQLQNINTFSSIELEYLKIALINNHKNTIKYYFNTENINKFDIPIEILYYTVFPDFDNFNNYNNYNSDSDTYQYTVKNQNTHVDISKNLEFVYNKLSSLHGKGKVLNYILDRHIQSLSNNLLFSIIRFHCKFILQDIIDIYGKEYFSKIFDNNIIEDLIQYGKYDVLKFIINFYGDEKFKTKLNNHSLSLDNLAAFNSDDRILKTILQLINVKNVRTINYHYYKFLEKENISDKSKIQKLKILNNHNKFTDKNKKNIMENIIVASKDKKLLFWAIAKLFDNKVSNTTPNLDSIIRQILLTNNLDIFEKFTKLCDSDFNYWNIFKVLIYYNITLKHYHEIINRIAIKLDNIRNYPLIETEILKALETFNGNYGYTISDPQKNKEFDYILKILKNCGVDFNKGYNNYNTSDAQYGCTYLLLGKINIPEFFKIGIMNGMSYPLLFKNYIHKNYYNKYIIFSEKNRPWLAMYKLIKKLEFRKQIQNKKNHAYNFYNTNVCINSRPPIENIPVLRKGGEQYYRDQQIMFSEMEWKDEEYIYPKHIQPLELLEISKNEIIVTNKIDGVVEQDINMSNVYPPISKHLEDCIFDGEYVEELNMYLVFGVRNKEGNINCAFDDFMEMRNDHIGTKYLDQNFLITCNNYQIIKKKIIDEYTDILVFHKNNKGKTLWWPKCFWKIFDTDIILDVLETFEGIQTELDLMCEEDSPNPTFINYIKNNILKTDGYIINIPHNKQQIYKLKPSKDMTIDLRYNGKWIDRQNNEYHVRFDEGKDIKGIYRCYYENGEWVARDYRPKKRNQNPKEVVDIVQCFHNNPWNIKELKPYKNPSYYQHFDNNQNKNQNPNLKVFTKHKNQWFSYYVKDNMKILDIGCGYLNGYLWNNPTLTIDGIDNDLGTINKFKKLTNNNNKKLLIQDFKEPWNFHNDCIKKEVNPQMEINNYDIILMNFSIHYSFDTETGFPNLMEEINKRSINKSTKLMISFIDKDLLFEDSNNIEFEDGGFFRRNKKELYGEIGEMTYYYPWRSNKINTEKIFGKWDIKKRLEDFGWYEYGKFNPESHINNMGYKELNKSIQRVVFIRK